VDRETAESLLRAYEEISSSLTSAEAVVLAMPQGTDRSRCFRALAELVATLQIDLRRPIYAQFPELQPQEPLPDEPNTTIDSDDLAAIAALSQEDIDSIDSKLVSQCAAQWRKAARVIGATMSRGQPALSELPVGFFAQRLIALVKAGRLESQGDLQYIRFSEVRLPPSGAA
jgi:hypothetical protein